MESEDLVKRLPRVFDSVKQFDRDSRRRAATNFSITWGVPKRSWTRHQAPVQPELASVLSPAGVQTYPAGYEVVAAPLTQADFEGTPLKPIVDTVQ